MTEQILVLHGGGGPATVGPIAEHLTANGWAGRVLAPTHPGWNGVNRPDDVATIGDIAKVYLRLLAERDLRDVLVIGSSLGGWIGMETALRDHGDRVSGLILIDAVGVDIEGEPIRDFFALDARGVAEYAWHDSERGYVDPATVPEDVAARQRANMATMRALAGDPYMHDPKLLDQLARIDIPVMAIWGESDRIVTPAYGRKLAAAFPRGSFELVRQAGHLPHLEQPAATLALIEEYCAGGRQEPSGTA